MVVHTLGRDTLNYVVLLSKPGHTIYIPIVVKCSSSSFCVPRNLCRLGTISNLRREYPTILAPKFLMQASESVTADRSILSGAFCNSRPEKFNGPS